MRWLWLLLFGATLHWTAGAALAQDRRPDARLEFSSRSYGLLLGVSQGKGMLEFRGQRYPFTVSGLRVATLGVARVDALGQVYRLRELADFAGRYLVVEGGVTVARGGGHAVLRNEKGVTLYLQNVMTGFDLTLGGGGMDIALSKAAEAAAPAESDRSAAPRAASAPQPSTTLPPLELMTTPVR